MRNYHEGKCDRCGDWTDEQDDDGEYFCDACAEREAEEMDRDHHLDDPRHSEVHLINRGL